ncbi:MAG: tRNA (adenosine(37)-N6)-threonylcarbamoyltransferase complex dimerization subunit type 1 TsaB [Gammaproteobacteria bacterium]|nr:tRNA (adenosine(37)-N6)-threonylcarbamoyltransferase complex dimerization subunit type 1 TsaB [Gammaproteobacteria bacterium]
MPRLLAFDTSTETLSVAVRHGDRVVSQSAAGGPAASATLLPLIQALMEEAGLRLGDLDTIAFGRGPGSFTGLRTACSVAQGLAFGAGIDVLPVDTLLAVAEEARHRFGAERVLALLDARMDQVYAARCDFGTTPPTVSETQLFSPEALVVPEGWAVAGNAWTAYGARLGGVDGATFREVLPGAEAILRLAPALLAAGHAVPPAEALPFYVRDKVAQTTEERAIIKASSASLS